MSESVGNGSEWDFSSAEPSRPVSPKLEAVHQPPPVRLTIPQIAGWPSSHSWSGQHIQDHKVSISNPHTFFPLPDSQNTEVNIPGKKLPDYSESEALLNTGNRNTRKTGRALFEYLAENGEETLVQGETLKYNMDPVDSESLPRKPTMRKYGVAASGSQSNSPYNKQRKRVFFRRKISHSLPDAIQNFFNPEDPVNTEENHAEKSNHQLLPNYGEEDEKTIIPVNGSAGGGGGGGREDRLRHPKVDPVRISPLGRAASRSSLASTIDGVKEKISMSLPSSLSKKPEDTGLRVFVSLLFLCCTGIILASHIFYRQHIGQLRLFQRVRLEEKERRMLLYDQKNELVLGAEIGIGIPPFLHPYTCLPEHDREGDDKCLEWKDHARLRILREEYDMSVGDGDGVTCHRLMWQSLNPNTMPLDCWPVGEGAGHWYGGGESLKSKWPLDHGHIKLSPFVTGDEEQTEWGNVIRKFFINSKGLSITIDDGTPLSVSLNDDWHPGLCLRANYDDFPYYYHRFNLPQLNYTVCTDGHLGEIYNSQLARAFWDGHKDSDVKELKRLLEKPLWQVPSTTNQTEVYSLESISAYIESIAGRTKLETGEDRGYLRLNYLWQDNMGDIAVTDKLRGIQQLASRAGLTLVLTLNPFVSTDSANFKEGVLQGLFVMERNVTSKTRSIPALTWFKDVPSAALLDITNPKTITWLKDRLRRLNSALNNTAFFLDTGNVFHTPHYFHFHQNLKNPDLYKEHFVKACMEEVMVIGVSGASSKRPKAPAFVQLTPMSSRWESLATIIHNVLHLGVIGYPFINPGPIGGQYSGRRSGEEVVVVGEGEGWEEEELQPSMELFIRWWQLATFLPQLHFSHPPSQYRNMNITGVAKHLKTIKETVVNPELIFFGREAMELSKPIIRPLWMINPLDVTAQQIDSQFLIGDRILVAPILGKGQRSRSVYLPIPMKGSKVWKRESDGTFFSGGQWIHNNRVELEEVLYFTRQAENSPLVGILSA